MSNQKVSRLLAQKREVKPLAERGRMLFVPDVVALLHGKKSAWWVRNRFAPEKKHKLGRDPFWWECDALEALDEDAA